ncbi:hypothetical protein HTZ84_12290 [Haloterrigena sp. SYSU A558-1]|uniref:Uncharacterized protein n=1 Tax=Haloterrigena gelatinilytica TaxID=2741724 RepID=A0A8J8KEH1_9EURY|nr:hypothetical protein [Haloterrigena gelatinilytica]NUB91213.1 hypothetical protein [Haloterrigena gelatinilytica]NUC73081.1 hypothetical protein [Haloterrigena gelatinilytica]
MIRRFAARFRDEIDRADVTTAAGFGAVLALSGNESTAIGIAVGLLVGVPFLTALIDTLEAPDYLSGVLIGGGVGVGSAIAAVNWFSWVFVALSAVGWWLCLDSLYDRRHGIDRSGPPEDPMDDRSFRENVRVVSDTGAIGRVLRESSVALSPAAIAARSEFSVDEVERLLEEFGDDVPIERVGDDRYTVNEAKMGVSGLMRDAIRRLCRPFSVLIPSR